ncbi:MAG: hypothetical protein H6752_08370 [Candidatus Omnitrophica bacterium]|nr:hypothetical protein [Candidatus Omnitrophota bacterium]
MVSSGFRINRISLVFLLTLHSLVSSSPSVLAADKIGHDLSQVLSWLPPDTETIAVCSDFEIPSPATDEEEILIDLARLFRTFVTGFMAQEGDPRFNALYGMRVKHAVFGARGFQDPKGFGLSLYEGAHVTCFETDMTPDRDKLFDEMAKDASRTIQIGGTQVFNYEMTLERDTWTYWVAWPKPQFLIIATNKDYLSQLLDRMNSEDRLDTILPSLPENEYIDLESPIWAVRHYSKSNVEKDSTSPFAKERGGEDMVDSGAIGFVINLPKSQELEVQAIYLSKETGWINRIKEWLPGDLFETQPKFEQSEKDGVHVLETSFEPIKDPDDYQIISHFLLWQIGLGVHL